MKKSIHKSVHIAFPKGVESKYLIIRIWSQVFAILGCISLFRLITKIRERTHKELKYLNTIEKELEEIENKKSKESVQEILGQIREVQEIKHKVVLLKRRIDSGTYRFVELWVLGNTILSIALFTVCSAPGLQWWELICIVYGAFQVFGIFVYQINVLFFDPLKGRGTYVLGGYTRIVILLIHNYVEIIFWFALFYRNMDGAFNTNGVDLNQFLSSLRFSYSTMTNFITTGISPKETFSIIVTLIQSVIGFSMALFILSRFISLLPKPETLDPHEKEKQEIG